MQTPPQSSAPASVSTASAEMPQTQEAPPASDQPVNISITLPTNAYFLSGIRDFTLTMTKNMTGFSEKWAFRFQSVVDELCNNAIEHGSAPGKEIYITFISHPQESLELVVEDTGTGPNKYTAVEMKKLFEEQRQKVQTQFLGLRGRGLAKIVGEWTDEIIFEDGDKGGLRVRVKKYLGADDTAPQSASPQQ
jgi:anti-sigma regulatory factor (Ser/Thr protein kinase)